MIKNDLVLLFESRSPLDYPILTPLVSLISLCALFEAGLILSLRTLTLTEIDCVSIIESSVTTHRKQVESPAKGNHNMLAYIGTRTLLEPYICSIGSKTRRYKDTSTHLDGQSHLMRITRTSAFPKEGIATHR